MPTREERLTYYDKVDSIWTCAATGVMAFILLVAGVYKHNTEAAIIGASGGVVSVLLGIMYAIRALRYHRRVWK